MFAVFALPAPTFADGAKMGLYEADVWDRMMKDPLCGVEVPVCWEEHLSRAEILDLLKIAHRKFYARPKFLARRVLGLETGAEFRRLAGALSLVAELLSRRAAPPQPGCTDRRDLGYGRPPATRRRCMAPPGRAPTLP